MSGEYREEFRQALEEMARMHMPFGKYGPKEFPPDGVPIYDLPWEYLHWFAQHEGFPTGRLGELMEMIYHMKSDGCEEVFDLMRRQAGGRHSLRKKRRSSYDFEDG